MIPIHLIDLGYRPRAHQLDVHRKAKRFTVVVAHRRFGKTRLAEATLMHSALATTRPDARYGYVAPFRNQAKGIAWDYLKHDARLIPGAEIAESSLSVTLPNQARIGLFGADNADAMRGLYFDGVVLDEVANFGADVWPAVVRPALTDRHGWSMMIGTPHGINQFSELYQHALTDNDPEWVGLLFRADESGIIEQAELDAARAVMSDAQYRQEFLCDFNAAADNVLITIDLVAAACQRAHQGPELEGYPKVIGVDVARFGDDRSVIQKRWGPCALEPIVLHGLDNMALASRVAHEIEEWKPDGVFVDAGRGEGVIDRLRSLGHRVVEVNFGAKALDPHYANKRTEMWDKMRKWLEAGADLPNVPDLKSDLCVPTYSFDANGRMQLEAKDKIKARGMPSPDCGDALAISFAMPVAAKEIGLPIRRNAHVVSDYDPFETEDDPWRPANNTLSG